MRRAFGCQHEFSRTVGLEHRATKHALDDGALEPVGFSAPTTIDAGENGTTPLDSSIRTT
jgi:hypothetical protein